MEYTVLRDGKTFAEYESFLESKILQREDLDENEKALLVQSEKELNTQWFNKAQKRKDKEDRLGKIKDIRLAMHLAGIQEPNMALVLNKIYDCDDYACLERLEAMIPQVDAEYQNIENDKIKEQNKKDSLAELKQYFADNGKNNISDITAADVKKIAWHLYQFHLEE